MTDIFKSSTVNTIKTAFKYAFWTGVGAFVTQIANSQWGKSFDVSSGAIILGVTFKSAATFVASMAEGRKKKYDVTK